jgi:sugar phosphate permease
MSNAVLPYASAPTRDRPVVAPGGYLLLSMLCAAAFIAYVQRSGMAMAVAGESMRDELGIADKVRLGTVLSFWNLGYALMQIPSGWLADRLGSRIALTLFALLWSVLTGLTGLATGFYSLAVLWTLMGVAQAGIFPCTTKAIRRWFPAERRASATGMLASCMGLGGALAPLLTGYVLTALAWRWVFFLYAVPGIVWAALFYLWVREAPAQPPTVTEAGVEDGGGTTDVAATPVIADEGPVWSRLLGSGSMWLLCAQQFLRAAAMVFFASWFPTFLRESRGATLVQSGQLTTLAGAGAVLGSLLGGFASDRVLALTGSRRLSRQGIAVAGMAACAVLIVCAYFVADRTLAVAVISAGVFCGTFGGVSGYTVAMDLGGRRVATVFSVMNMCGNFGATLFPLAIGWLVHKTGNWDLVLFIFAGIFALDAVCWALLNPKEPLFEGD